jgi:hypothetical protein
MGESEVWEAQQMGRRALRTSKTTRGGFPGESEA